MSLCDVGRTCLEDVHIAVRRIFHPRREEVMGGCRKLHIYGFGQP